MLSRPDAELVARDRAVQGLGVLLDPEAVLAGLRAARPELGLTGATAHYVRYKPGTSCIVGYRLAAPGGAIDAYGRAYGADGRAKFEKAAADAAPEGVPRRVVMSELLTLVYLFPDDPGVPALPSLADAGARRALLGRVLPGRPEWWDGTLHRLAYKPERRFVAQLRDAGGVPRAVIKLYSAGFAGVSRNAKVTWGEGALRTARRLGRSEKYSALALEWVPGATLAEVLGGTDNGNVATEAATKTGAALAALHGHRGIKLTMADVEAEAVALRAAAEAVGAICPELGGRSEALAGRLGALSRSSAAERARAVHGDFYAKQVVIARDGSVVFLDMDEGRRDDPMVDLANFAAHVEKDVLAGRLGGEAGAATLAALEEGYVRAGGNIDRAAREWRTAAALLRLVAQPFRDRAADWPARVGRLLDRAERYAGGVA
jgi:hypothetical protein